MSDWQLIETAPKDGTKIIGYYPKSFGSKVFTMTWHHNSWLGGPYSNSLEFPGTESCPTHWMPFELPK